MDKAAIENSLNIKIQFNKREGLLPCVVQDHLSLEILMLGYVSKEAYEKTLKTGKATFYSTSRNELWTKGETSGDYLAIEDIYVDCDQDALIYLVKALGNGSCHTKNSQGKTRNSCFYRKVDLENNKLQWKSPELE